MNFEVLYDSNDIDPDDYDEIELRRAPGTCCPEPSCDYLSKESGMFCEGRGHACDDCQRKA
jgi:hypothetical protein